MSGRVVDALALAAVRVLAGLFALRAGFSHVSDDDYARTVIAEQFAHAPRLDPSGTSWLPFPFWLLGGAMMAFGRSLDVAGAIALTTAAVASALFYFALRAVKVSRLAAFAGVFVASVTPWNAWLGAAPVPEGFTGALMALATILAAAGRAPVAVGAALFASCLSRYEAWPVALVVAVGLVLGTPTTSRRLLGAGLAVAGPLAWMLWNAHAHGDALHFLARVQRFRLAAEGGSLPLTEKLLTYPRALSTEAPELLALGAVGALLGLRTKEHLERWRVPFLALVAMLAFLIWGDVHDGAPTHHPVRALTACFWVLAASGVDGIVSFIEGYAYGWPKRESFALGLVLAAGLAWGATISPRLRDFPGTSDYDRRDSQVARGLELRREGIARATVTPCAYEHFALIAAFGTPERVEVLPSTHTPPSPSCPAVSVADHAGGE